jgi:glycosyltransferase involved in cell wall biosynthesis
MRLGLRPRVPFPLYYRDFRLIRTHGRVYGFPASVEAKAAVVTGLLFSHPATLSAATWEELVSLIDDRFPAGPEQPTIVANCQEYDLVRYRGELHGVPRIAGAVDLALVEERRRAGVVTGKSREEVQAQFQARLDGVPVEFAGWLPIYERSGDCGRHPQFTHTTAPPAGYRFTCSAPPEQQSDPTLWDRTISWLLAPALRITAKMRVLSKLLISLLRPVAGVNLGARLRVLTAFVRLGGALPRRGASPAAVWQFLHTRHLRSQLLLSPHRGLVFFTSMPYTYGQNPWVVEIEDPTTLFYPLIQNGGTCDLRIRESPYFPIIKTLLEADQCKGIVTHIRSTAEMVPTLFGSEIIRKKVFYTPLGVKLPSRWQRHEGRSDAEEIHLLFINSWCQVPENFYVRGGLDVLEAFAILHERYPQLRLTMRTALPALDGHYYQILESGWVRVINRFLPAEEMAALHANSHIFLLPAARIHVVSLLQAMSYGLAVVASDGWGMEEYLHHERNGLIVKGRYGKVSWADQSVGMLREDYEPMATADSVVVQGIVDAVSRLVEDRGLRARLGRTARNDVETKYTVERWNQNLKAVFDQASGNVPTTAVASGVDWQTASAE